jgi:NAD(P)-dependent dehydrogenase (short-subunit alcohol dehydrogenase family)
MRGAILVTGGASGIGRAVVEAVTAEGWRAVVLDLPGPALEAARAAFDPASVRCTALDVSDEAGVVAEVAAVERDFAPIEGAVNSAGIARDLPVLETGTEVFRRILEVNVLGSFVVAREAARAMRGRGGAIVNIASTNAEQPGEGMAAYCVAKAGVVMFNQVAAIELAAHGIRVVGVGPGLTDTPATAPFLNSDATRAAYLGNIAAGRAAHVDEIAGLIAYLASPEAAYVNGETVYIDGMLRARGYPTLKERRGPAYAGSAFLRELQTHRHGGSSDASR